MEEEQKQDYREHLINTIDMLIDSGISVYDLNVVNKKAIRYNYVPKQKVKDKIKEAKYNKKVGNTAYEYTEEDVWDIVKDELEELLEEK